MSARLRVRVAVAVTALATLLGVGLPVAALADTAPPKAISGELNSVVGFAPATTETYAWRPVNDADVPSWLHAVGLGNCANAAGCNYGDTMTELLIQIKGNAPYGASVTFPVVEYTHSGREVVYDLTVTAGSGITVLSPVVANAVPGQESYVPVRGTDTLASGYPGWWASGGPDWLGRAGNSGTTRDYEFTAMSIRVPADVPVGSEWTTRITEQQRASDGRDIGRIQYDLTLRVRPPLEAAYPVQQYTTQFDQPLVVPEARLTAQLPSPDDLLVTGAFAAQSRTASYDRSTVSWTPELSDAGRVVPVTWQVGYDDVQGYSVPRTAQVRVAFDEGPQPVAGRGTVQKKLRAGKTVRIPLGVGAQHSTPFVWQVTLQTVRRSGSQLDPAAINAMVETVGERAYAVVRTTQSVRSGGYYIVARLTDRYGKSAKHRLATLTVR